MRSLALTAAREHETQLLAALVTVTGSASGSPRSW